MRRHLSRALVLLVLAAGAAGCGGSSDDGETTVAATTTAPATTTAAATATVPAVTTISVDVVDAKPSGGIARPSVDKGSRVVLIVTSDTADEVHVHGYDL